MNIPTYKCGASNSFELINSPLTMWSKGFMMNFAPDP